MLVLTAATTAHYPPIRQQTCDAPEQHCMPPTADADAELAREQAAETSALWAVGDFDAAQQTLQRLEATLPGDARVQLNLWVTGYYADASTSLDSVAKELEAWLKAHPADPGDFSQHNSHAVAAVNYGLILSLQQQHASALAVLEPLFEHVDILQDGTALCLCALLLEIYLDSCQLPKAVEVLQYLQCQCPPQGFPGLGGQAATCEAGNSSSSQAQHARPGSRSPRKQEEREGQKEAGTAAAGGGNAEQGSAQQLGGDGQQQDAVVSLSQALPTTSKTQGKRMQEIFQLVQQKCGKVAGQDLAPLLHLYKARLALACHNHKAAKKEVRGLLSCEPDSPEGLLLKAQLETCKQQPRKALKTLAPLLSTQHQHTIRCRLQLLNLLAAVHHQLDKHHVAALYLSTALNLHAEAQQQQNPQPPAASKPEPQRKQQGKRQQKKQQQQQQQQQGKATAAGADAAPAPAPTATPAATAQSGSSGGAEAAAVVPRQSHWLLVDMSDALHYNLGLQQLALQDWQAAMECFEAASSKYFTMPQLWLRWAEACIGLYHQQQQQLAAEVAKAQAGESSGGGALGKGKGVGKQGKGQPPSKKQLQQQQQLQQQLISSSAQLLQQAAAHLSTALVIVQEQQAAAAKQLEAVTAAAAAAVAAGEPPPDVGALPVWPGFSAAAGVGPGGVAGAAGGSTVDHGASSTSAAAAGASSAAAAAAGGGGAVNDTGPSTPTAGSTAAGITSLLSTAFSSLPPEAALLAPELAALKQALLTNKAYVALALNQPAEALSAAQELVACSSMSPHQHYLGTSYAAEALVMLGRVEEAKQQLRAHAELFMNSSSAAGLPGVPAGLQHQGLVQQQGLGMAGPSGFSAGEADGIGSLFGTAAAAGASGPGLQNSAMGNAPGPGLATHPTAGSTKSFDGSCISCTRGVCAGHGGQAGVSGPDAGLGPEQHASVLHNMGVLLMMQGDHEGHRHAAMAASLQVAAGQQDGLGGMQLPPQVPGQQGFMPGGPGL